MVKDQVIRFIANIVPYKIKVKYVSSSEILECYAAQISKLNDSSYLLELNRKIFLYDIDMTYLKATLLHELGHITTTHRKRSMEEYKAHQWAIRTAHRRRFTKIHKELIALKKSWKTFTWNQENGHYRCYIKAATISD
jgi:hypothetical protein